MDNPLEAIIRPTVLCRLPQNCGNKDRDFKVFLNGATYPRFSYGSYEEVKVLLALSKQVNSLPEPHAATMPFSDSKLSSDCPSQEIIWIRWGHYIRWLTWRSNRKTNGQTDKRSDRLVDGEQEEKELAMTKIWQQLKLAEAAIIANNKLECCGYPSLFHSALPIYLSRFLELMA
ncbi:hypothetical protein RRG08_026322 [Elysia crispata]|uniref:Uncharacterized protein n=1 Tax=Elysia crispata TaxID=231223 RepID=A0AAE1DDE7_9GAST|nr:hypothetical protein RRG08_026322 [Elysia crispata]